MAKTLHGYSGSCAPGNKCLFTPATFSVGVFPLVLKADGKGYKHGTVLVRVKGLTSSPEKVYQKAREIMDLLDKGEYTGPKIVNVK